MVRTTVLFCFSQLYDVNICNDCFKMAFLCVFKFSFLMQNMAVLFYRLVVPNKGYSSLDQSPDEKPLVALDTDR